jgi:hypothetical protein
MELNCCTTIRPYSVLIGKTRWSGRDDKVIPEHAFQCGGRQHQPSDDGAISHKQGNIKNASTSFFLIMFPLADGAERTSAEAGGGRGSHGYLEASANGDFET